MPIHARQNEQHGDHGYDGYKTSALILTGNVDHKQRRFMTSREMMKKVFMPTHPSNGIKAWLRQSTLSNDLQKHVVLILSKQPSIHNSNLGMSTFTSQQYDNIYSVNSKIHLKKQYITPIHLDCNVSVGFLHYSHILRGYTREQKGCLFGALIKVSISFSLLYDRSYICHFILLSLRIHAVMQHKSWRTKSFIWR